MIKHLTLLRPVYLALLCLIIAIDPSRAQDPVYVRFNTVLGNMDVEMLSNDAPNNVANFLSYVDSGAYAKSFFHRLAKGTTTPIDDPLFIFQGGAYYFSSPNVVSVIATPSSGIADEIKDLNVRGTLAAAKTSQPNSITSQWYVNYQSNPGLDGGYTVFGRIVDNASLGVMDAISQVPVPYPPYYSGVSELPLIGYSGSNAPVESNYVIINSITRLNQTYTAWQTAYSAAGPTATPQKDGIPNLLKYLYDINPMRPLTAADRAALPVVATATISGNSYLTLTYRQYREKTGVTLNVQTSPDLQMWTNQTAVSTTPVAGQYLKTQTGSDPVTGDPIMQIEIPASATREFVRLDVTVP